MDDPLKMLLSQQQERGREDAEFVSRLDPARTALLEDLMAKTPRPERTALLRAPWLDRGRFVARLASASIWLEGVAMVPDKGWGSVPLMFFQAVSSEKDAEEHRRLLETEAGEPPACRLYTRRFAGLPTSVRYLHLHTSFTWMMRGSYERGDLAIVPFGAFSAHPEHWFLTEDEWCALQGGVFGYQVPDYAELLDVSSEVATDFLARLVVHDLAHAHLPTTPNVLEGFHNVAALAAMGSLPPVAYRNDWERLVHAECTDPAFCLRAADELAAVRRRLAAPLPVQKHILAGYERWYAHPNAARKRREVWGLPDGADEEALCRLIQRARADGFALYRRY